MPDCAVYLIVFSLTENGWKSLRVRVLIGLRDHADLADDALLVDLARRAVFARPLVHGPALDTFLVRIRHLVVLAVMLDCLLRPRLFDNRDDFLIDPAVMVVDRGAVHRRAGDLILLA